MRQLYLLFLFLLTAGVVLAQTPIAFPYQGIAMDKNGTAIANQQIGVQISILLHTHDGTSVYEEHHYPTTTDKGHFNLAVGRGRAVKGSFRGIDWREQHFIALGIDMDITDGRSFEFVGSTELLSVPYAFYAQTAGNLTGPSGRPGPSGEAGPPGLPGINGVVGEKGLMGLPGAQGRVGMTGPPPPTDCCLPGPFLPACPVGPAGPAGNPGVPGKSGLANLKQTNSIPTNPVNGRIYLDDGTNRIDGKAGLRYYDVNQWVDL